MQFHIRPYQGSDEADLLALWHAALTHDPISPALFRTQVLLDANFRPDHLVVAEAGGVLAGFVLVLTRQVPLFLHGLEPGNAWITAFGVHPDYQRQGIGRAMFAHVDTLLRAEGRTQIDIAPYVPNYFTPGVDIAAYPGALRFLAAAGYQEQSRAISMGVDLSDWQEPPAIRALAQQRAAEGLTIQPVTAADLPDLLPFIVEHFGWDWFRHAQAYLLDYFGGSPQDICFLVARQAGEIAGYCQQRGERFGPFGVAANQRGRGIGRLLLFCCLKTMRARQVYFAYFLWTGERAARLYGQAGFVHRRTFALFRRMLLE